MKKLFFTSILLAGLSSHALTSIDQSVECFKFARHCDAGCAPSVVDSNVRTIEAVSAQIASDPQFANANKFQAEIKHIAGLTDNKQKATAYFLMIDVSTQKDIAQFIGAREGNLDRYQKALQKNENLTDSQSRLVVKEFQKALSLGLE